MNENDDDLPGPPDALLELGPPPSAMTRLRLEVVRPRLLDKPSPSSTAKENEQQRQKDIRALTKILEAHGVPFRLLYRCRARTEQGVCDAYRVSGEPCVLCDDGLPPRAA